MKLFLVVAAAVTSLSLGAPAPLQAQDGEKDSPLAALAKKTKKKSESSGSKVIGEQDLRTTKSRVTIPPASAAPAASSAGDAAQAAPEAEGAPAGGAADAEAAEPEKTPAEQRAEQRAELQEQVDQQRWLISELEKKKAEAQTELADSTTMGLGSPRRATLLQLVQNCDTQIAEARQKIADLQTQARRAGVAVR